ncbi:PKD domain-containing protein, partial [Subsaxibacter sp. CAU 1640]|uniref:HYR-like domain-containing protein n=1 Tax=Subsaxibacter sp. CAU 1640 TaxID=2933271 RepID=UPI0020049B48
MKTNTYRIGKKYSLFFLILLIQAFAFGQRNASLSSTKSENIIVESSAFSDCTANDFRVGQFYLADSNGNPLNNTCTPGNIQSGYIYAVFTANTNANRYSLYIDYDIYINGVFSSHVTDCIFPQSPIPVGPSVRIQQINWTCGDRIEFKNYYMAWQSSSNASCGTNPSKCFYSPLGFVVNAPLIANFTIGYNCNSYLVNLASTTTGGNILNPYSYQWDINNDGSVEYTVANPNHTFPGPGTYTVKLTVFDSNGTSDSQIYNVVVSPHLQGLILNVTNIPCTGGYGSIVASGTTGGTGNYTYSISPQPNGYVQNGNQFSNLPAGTYTVTVRDGRACTISRTATIVVIDNTNPTINAPNDILVEGCSANDATNGNLTTLPYSPTPVSISVQQFNANGGTFVEQNVASITYQDHLTTDICPRKIDRTFTITDNCGGTASDIQFIIIQDSTPPVVPSPPADVTYECFDDVPLPSNLSANDTCSGTITSLGIDSVSGTDTCNYIITRTWTFTDSCGNSSVISQSITVRDDTPPTINNVAADQTVLCDGSGNTQEFQSWLNTHAGAMASDNCSEVIWTYEILYTTSQCGGSSRTLVRFIATDECNNSSTTTALFTILDLQPPTIVTNASDLTVECDGNGNMDDLNSWLASQGGATASDACSNVTWTNNYSSLSDECGATGSATVTFTATDECGNTATSTATFTIEDTTPPVIDAGATDLTVECDGNGNMDDLNSWLASNGGASASDACSNVTWTNNYSSLSDECGATGSATVTFTATDECGNTATSTATFTIEDTTPPVIDAGATDLTVECDGNGNMDDLNSWLAAQGGATASDACSNVTWTNNYSSLSDECGATGSATVTFTATDECGNTATSTATFTIEDTTPPVLDVEATNITIECDGNGNNGAIEEWLNNNGNATASDACSNVTWTNNYAGEASDCSLPVEVTFTATDECGNSVSTTATYTIQDTVPPVINGGADLTVECDGNGNMDDLNSWLASNGGATASDDCSAISWSNNFSSLSDECGATGSATVTFTVTDGCGNSASTTVTFTIEDTTPPVIDAGATDLTVECDGNGNMDDLNSWLAAQGGA